MSISLIYNKPLDEDDEVVYARGIDAIPRVLEGSKKLLDDWWLIAEALELKRSRILEQFGLKTPHGSRYKKVMTPWLQDTGFSQLHPTERNACHRLMEKRKEIELWVNTLPALKQRKLNQPAHVIVSYRRYIQREGLKDRAPLLKKKTLKQERDEARRDAEETSIENDELKKDNQWYRDEADKTKEEYREEIKEETEVRIKTTLEKVIDIAKRFIPKSKHKAFEEAVRRELDEEVVKADYQPMFEC